MSDKKSILKGAAILIVANFIVKFIGVIYKIPLMNLIGGYGMGFFNSAFEIYQMLLAFSTAGLPVAVSKMVSESYALKRYSEVNKIFRVALMTFVGVGLFGTLIMFFGASIFSNMINSELTKYSIMALAPAVLFFSIVAIFRGYFQGMHNMNPTAITQIIEAVCKLVIGISLTVLALRMALNPEYISAMAILGTTISTVVATVLLVLIYNTKYNKNKIAQLKSKGGECRSTPKIIKDLIKIVIPVTAGSLVVNLTGFLDLFLIMNRLSDIGMTEMQATFIYGSYKSCAQTLFNLPPSIIASVNVTIIPLISAAFALKNTKKLQGIINKSLKIIIIFALPCAVGLMVLAEPILLTLFPTRLDEVLISTPLLQVLGMATLWTTIASLATAMLQASGNVTLPIKAIAIGGAVKLVTNYILIGIPSIGIMGAPIATNLCYIIIMVINLHSLKKSTNIKISFIGLFAKPLFASIVMGVVAVFTHKFLIGFVSNAIATIGSIGLAGALYLVIIVLIRGISDSDLAMVPGGKKIARFLRR